MEIDEQKNRLKVAAEMIREERRKYTHALKLTVEGEHQEMATEDTMRLVGTLEAAYNHCLASIAGDGDIYCILKHLSYAIILAGEMDEPGVEKLYEIIGIVSNGVIEPCADCRQDENRPE